MKTPRFTSILRSSLFAGTIALASFATDHSALAQSSQVLAKVNIPFAFQAGDRRMPAGMYEIDSQTGSPLLLLRNSEQEVRTFVITHTATTSQPPAKGRVVFERYGNKYFLRQVWTASSTQGAELPTSKAEKEIVKAMNDEVVPSPIQVALNTQR